jgi:5-methylcytosine-specific restriction endonuclease McrA
MMMMMMTTYGGSVPQIVPAPTLNPKKLIFVLLAHPYSLYNSSSNCGRLRRTRTPGIPYPTLQTRTRLEINSSWHKPIQQHHSSQFVRQTSGVSFRRSFARSGKLRRNYASDNRERAYCRLCITSHPTSNPESFVFVHDRINTKSLVNNIRRIHMSCGFFLFDRVERL